MAACCSAPWDDDLEQDLQPQGYQMVVPMVDERLERRKELLDGLEIRCSNNRIPQFQRTAISWVRTLLFGAVLAGTTAGIYFTHEEDLGDKPHLSPMELKFDVCAGGEPQLLGKDTNNVDGLQAVLGQKEHKVLRFFPYQSESEEPTNLALESLWYYESEEMYALPRENAYGFSLMMFGNRALLINVEIGRDISCLPQGDDKAKERNALAEDKLGAAIVQQLIKADRRTPHANIPLVPQVHGAMLIQNGDKTMWSVALGKFGDVYQVSPAMSAYRIISPMLQVVATALACAMLFRAGFKAWWQHTETWVVQYDFLWNMPDLQSETLWAKNSGGNLSSSQMKSMMRDRSAWRLFHVCGVFFVLDHAVGNPAINDERWGSAIGSTLVQACTMVSLVVFPIIHGRFFREFQILAYGLTAAHFLQCFGFSVCYYFSFNAAKRQGFYYGYLVTAFSCLFYTMTYGSGIVLFLCTRAVIMPQEAASVVGTLGGVITYAVVLTVGLRQMRHKMTTALIEKATTPEQKSKGFLQKQRHRAGLDVKTIWINVIGGTVVLSLMGSMFVLVSQLYFDRDGGSQFIACGVTAGIGLFMLAKQLQGSDEAMRVVQTGVEAD